MARNKNFDLTAAQRIRADYYRHMLKAPADARRVVTLEFTKRDGTESVATGFVERVYGAGSAETVTLSTDNGYKSVNMWAIKSLF